MVVAYSNGKRVFAAILVYGAYYASFTKDYSTLIKDFVVLYEMIGESVRLDIPD
jgi:hypothetical protein